MCHSVRPQINQLFEEADEDGSGWIEFVEFCILVRAMNPAAINSSQFTSALTTRERRKSTPRAERVTTMESVDIKELKGNKAVAWKESGCGVDCMVAGVWGYPPDIGLQGQQAER